jgi:uncharacterized membrane protein YfcA
LVFPALLLTGLTPLAANVTNAIIQWPGSAGLVIGSASDLRGQRVIAAWTTVAVGAGGVVGGCALLVLPSDVFDALVPALVAAASLLMAFGRRLRRYIDGRRAGRDIVRGPALWLTLFVSGVYGGYFGGAMGIILISVMALLMDESLARLNALKGLQSLAVASVGAIIFTLGAPVHWGAIAIVAPGTLIGGVLGARLARRLRESVLRWCVVILGLAVAFYLAIT